MNNDKMSGDGNEFDDVSIDSGLNEDGFPEDKDSERDSEDLYDDEYYLDDSEILDDDADWEAYCRTRNAGRRRHKSGHNSNGRITEFTEYLKNLFKNKKFRLIFISSAAAVLIVAVVLIAVFSSGKEPDIPAGNVPDTPLPETHVETSEPQTETQPVTEPEPETPVTPSEPEPPKVTFSILSDVFGYQLGAVETAEGTLYGVYDRNGNTLVEPLYASISMVDKGHFIVVLPADGSYALINIGNKICASGYTGMSFVKSGTGTIIVIADKNSDKYILNVNGAALTDGPCTELYCPEDFDIMYFRDASGALVIFGSNGEATDRYEREQFNFTDKLFVEKKYFYISETDSVVGLYGVQDSQGVQVIEPIYSSMTVLNENRLLAVADPHIYGKSERAVIYDGSCKVVSDKYAWAEFYFDAADVLTAGIAYKYNSSGSVLYYVINTDGNPLTPACSQILPNASGTEYQLVLTDGTEDVFSLFSSEPETDVPSSEPETDIPFSEPETNVTVSEPETSASTFEPGTGIPSPGPEVDVP